MKDAKFAIFQKNEENKKFNIITREFYSMGSSAGL